jgi:CRP/FNR family transcriptional regulator, cyclic AMP receptor protein
MPDSAGLPLASLAESLGRTPMFSNLTDRQLKRLAKDVKVRSFPPGTVLLKRGEGGVGLYLLLGGSVEVRKGQRTLARLGPGQFFGEMTLLDDQPRSADVVTTEPTQAAILSKWEFWGFAMNEPAVLRTILQEMARRLRETDRALSE